jgi:two-component system chemotaxis sensor kinase CheA
LKIFELNTKSTGTVANKIDKKPSASLGQRSAEVVDDKIGISVSVLDNFMELSGRLTVLRNTLIKSATVLEQRYFGDSEIEIVTDSLGDMHKVSSILQNEISEMRKVSLQTVYKPLRRVVRDSAKTLNKNIDLVVEGDELRVDTSIGKALSNSLVHMIRNSIDHGIELPEKRVEAGKSNTGLIYLKSTQDGENIIVELSDDGNGLNLNRIKQKAIEKNLYTEDQLKTMSDQKIFALIFDSGFSTAQQVSDISGRGVGMDMVRNSIESTGGNIVIDSKQGVGTRFVLTLPIPRSVLIIKSLMIKSDDAIFSIPLDEVGEVIRLEDYQNCKVLHDVEGCLLLSHHFQLLPLVDLSKVLHGKNRYHQMDVMNIVLVRGDGFKFGIIVDEILDIEEIVVKKMSQHLKNANCFLGITFIGHGALALILNLQAIGEKAHVKFDDEVGMVTHLPAKKIVDMQEFMQFNFHQTKNYAFSLHLVNRLEEVSSQDIEFSGAMPIVRYRGVVMPLLFIERQLGLCSVNKSIMELYPTIVKVIVVDLHNKKFGIVVDEILDIGLTPSDIVTENVDRAGFIGTIFIAEKSVTVIDVHYLIDHYVEFEKRVQEEEFSKANYEEKYLEDEAA